MNPMKTAGMILATTVLASCGSSEISGSPKTQFLTGDETNMEVGVMEITELPVAPGDRYRTHSDRLVTQHLRHALNEDPQLQPLTPLVHITTLDGNVTLTGSVPTENDKTAIGVKTQEIIGTDNVANQLIVQEN